MNYIKRIEGLELQIEDLKEENATLKAENERLMSFNMDGQNVIADYRNRVAEVESQRDHAMSRANAAEDKIASSREKAEKSDDAKFRFNELNGKLHQRVAELEKERDELKTHMTTEPPWDTRVIELQAALKRKDIEKETLLAVIERLTSGARLGDNPSGRDVPPAEKDEA